MHDTDPGKRIPKSLNTEPKLLGRYTLMDAAVGLSPGVVVILLTQILLPDSLTIGGYSMQTLTIPLAGVAILVGGIFVVLTPDYTTSLDWLQTITGFYTQSQEHDHEAAQRFTQIERLHPGRGALERTDGAFIGMVQVEPPNMALATEAEWAEKADDFTDFLNTVVEFPIQIFSTTREFPVETYLAHFESRLTDPDVKANPRLAALIEEYLAWYEMDMQQRQTSIRDHYVVVSVTPAEVQFDRASLAWTLARLPVLGSVIRLWLAPPIESQREAMFEALEQRLSRVETGFREMDGCEARQLPVAEAAELIASFWTGEDISYPAPERMLRRRPVIGGPNDE